jgi:mannose-6-phosphate isomerase
MGTHLSAPSDVAVAGSTQTLQAYLGAELAFLFKVLSIRVALSVQAHPNKQLAKKLHAAHPDVYKDSNHKPEMAVAVTRFEAMCGFRRLEDIAAYLQDVPELRTLIGETLAEEFAGIVVTHAEDSMEAMGVLKRLFTAVMVAPKETLTTQVESLVTRLQAQPANPPPTTRNLDIDELVVRLYGQHGADVGVVAPYLLNSFVCYPGEYVFLVLLILSSLTPTITSDNC